MKIMNKVWCIFGLEAFCFLRAIKEKTIYTIPSGRADHQLKSNEGKVYIAKVFCLGSGIFKTFVDNMLFRAL